MPLLKANRQLTGDFGTVAPDQIFEVSEDDAELLESRGLAERYSSRPPAAKMRKPSENKMLAVPENK